MSTELSPLTPPVFDPGVYFDMPAEVYHKAAGLSHSMQKHLNPPARLPVYLAEKHEPSVAMIMGTLVHAAILEPDQPLPKVAIKPKDMKFSTNEGKAWRVQAEARGDLIVPHDEWIDVQGMITSIAHHPTCRELFSVGRSEVSLFAQVSDSVIGKARIDWLPGGGLSDSLADIKTVSCQFGHEGGASEEEFSKTLFYQRYYTQAAWYLRLWNLLNPDQQRQYFIFVAVEKEPPYLVAVYHVDQEDLDLGAKQNDRDLRAYEQGLKTGLWKGYPEKCRKIKIPRREAMRLNNLEHKEWERAFAGGGE